jgi:hypothetical protein
MGELTAYIFGIFTPILVSWVIYVTYRFHKMRSFMEEVLKECVAQEERAKVQHQRLSDQVGTQSELARETVLRLAEVGHRVRNLEQIASVTPDPREEPTTDRMTSQTGDDGMRTGTRVGTPSVWERLQKQVREL